MYRKLQLLTFRNIGGVRRYSEQNDGSKFLTELLGRIDRLSLNTARIAQAKNLKRVKAKKPNSQEGSKESSSNHNTVPDKGNVVIADHPLHRSRIQKDGKPKFKTNNRPERTNFNGSKSSDKRTNYTPKTQKSGSASRNRTHSAKSSKTPEIGESSVKTKAIKHEPLKPVIDNTIFFYGKNSGVNTSSSTRLASVAKEILDESNYPYLLPKEIIAQITPDVARNRFLLQSNFNLNVDAQKLASRVKEVVKGDSPDLAIDKTKFKGEALKNAIFLKQQLMRNSSYSISNKEFVFNFASGLKSPKEVNQSAHWQK